MLRLHIPFFLVVFFCFLQYYLFVVIIITFVIRIFLDCRKLYRLAPRTGLHGMFGEFLKLILEMLSLEESF